MKLRYFIFLLLALSSLTFAQKKRFLISPTQEVIPLDAKESARGVMQARLEALTRARMSTTNSCSNSVQDGFTPGLYYNSSNTISRFGGYHKDVLGEWFVSPYTGTVDTIFWAANGTVGAKDSTLYLRVHTSNISPTSGPGVRPGPYNPPCQDWGYFKNTNDPDRQVAAFQDDLPPDDPDTAWVSTIQVTQPGAPPSFEPYGSELWGLGGYAVKIHAPGSTEAYRVHAQAMSAIPPALEQINLNKGDVFFISMRVNGPTSHPTYSEDATQFLAVGLNTTINPDYRKFYPSRNWKFYEHDSGPTNCAGQSVNNVKRGWIARGGFVDDTNSVAAYLYWYSVTTNDNTPPQVLSATSFHNTLSTAPRTVYCELQDCDPANPSNAGVSKAYLTYALNGVYAGAVEMDQFGGNTWTADLPGEPVNTTLAWSIVAIDNDSLVTTVPEGSYKVVSLKNEFFESVSDTCTTLNIRHTGTEIPSSAFFLQPAKNANATNPKDDGTAGPFDLGGPFYLFGQEYRYAWVAVNGAIGLSKTAADTMDVNDDGSYTTGYDFPMNIKRGQRDTSTNAYPPAPFIAPFWNDLYYGDTTYGSQFGHILYQDLGCKWVCQWGDSIGVFLNGGASFVDNIAFRVILDKCTGTIQFQYDNVGLNGSDTTATIGIQCDTMASLGNKAPWAYINRFYGPEETVPTNGSCYKIYPTGAAYVKDKWNLVSVANVPRLGYAKTNVFPTAVSSAYSYSAGYQGQSTLANNLGYWLKFNGSQIVGAPGASTILSAAIPVVTGWNLIGSISCPISTTSITDAVVSGSVFYGYNNGYYPATTILSGVGYWVKASGNGNINVACNDITPGAKTDANYAQLSGASKITIIDAHGATQTLYVIDDKALKVSIDHYELPPVPPNDVFDARFASGRAVESYSSEAGKLGEYGINIQAAAYPVQVQYQMNTPGKSVVISQKGSNTILNGSGTIRITDPSVSSLKVKVVDDLGTPKVYALSQNYPNPFNPVTRFTVDVPNSGTVEISVFDILGHKIATLMSGEQEAGRKNVEWDGKDSHGINSPSGMYFVRMTAGDFSQVRKIMLLK